MQPENNQTLHAVNWGRVVLDEGTQILSMRPFDVLIEPAHIIREPTKSFAKSVCALQAECRWAVTGTPIQNRLMDLFSLFKFLQCFPFDDLKTFNAHVTQRWKTKSDPNSVAKLKTLVNCLSLRRPKTTIELPPRKDETTHLDFSDQEMQYYERVKSKTLLEIDTVNNESSSSRFINALQWVNELRLICNHGTTKQKAVQELEGLPVTKPGWSEAEAQSRFNQLDLVGLAKCSNPDCNQDLSSALSSETDTDHADEPRFEESLELLCASCFQNRSGRAGKFFKVCNHLPRRPANAVALAIPKTSSYAEETLPTRGSLSPGKEGNISSKIKKLVQDLSETPGDIKRFTLCHP